MPGPRALALLIVLLAGCGKGDSSSSSSGGPASGARRIEGGTAVAFRGVTFDIPKTWRSQRQGDVALLAPDGANPGGIVEELYLVGGDPAVTALDSPAFERSIEQTIRQLQPGASRTSGPEAKRFGDLDGKAWVYSAKAQNGQEVEIRVHGFMGDCGCALIAFGYPAKLSSRSADLDAILGSLSKPAAAPAGTESVRQELVGSWCWISNFNANSGGGRQTDTTLNLNADGSYTYRHNHVSSNPEGAAWGSESDQGTWTATERSITFRSANGRTYVQQLEKRNHPKNVNDPMIVLDGRAFVTATVREPWR